MGRSARSVLLGLIALAAAGGCGGNDTPPAPAGATVPRSAPTTAPADPYSVPATIDAAYLNRVFEALERVDGDATRLIVAGKAFVPEAAKRLRAIYAEDEFQKQVNLWLDLVNEGVTGFREPPGDRRTTLERIASARSDCVFAAVKRDYTEVTGSAGVGRISYLELRPLDRERDKFRHNPTPWMIATDGYNPDGSIPDDPCAG